MSAQSHNHKDGSSRGVFAGFEIFPQSLVEDFSELCRQDRKTAFRNLYFNAKALGLLVAPKVFARDEERNVKHVLAATCMNAKGEIDKELRIAITKQTTYPGTPVEKYDMEGFKVNLQSWQIGHRPNGHAYIDAQLGVWLDIEEPFGPFVDTRTDPTRLLGWDDRRIQDPARCHSLDETRLAGRLAGILGSYKRTDEAVLTTPPVFPVQ